ncbi:HAD family hydrolase [Halieaceae bacterium IMCC14734]|uniref:HAD family hydrolase n=1 Tax=Candidatus Litorirhabdus singularis TaxID=2518993 RepID=A0ABT3TGE3_9GAMM|nr:HAD-IA family hydrolase [Candidatus Litorirhabdus singularis]MCX2981383.1 HAD family hydrolase [Candidatus Litorirhabdus singularis]
MLVIFDWDGTLSDSTGRIVEAMQGAAGKLGIDEPPADAVRDIIGLGLPEALQILFPTLPGADHIALRDAYSDHYRYLDRQPCALFPGAMPMLEQLRGRGWQLAVATGKSRRGLDRVLGALGLGDFFDATRCADETASKPDPLMLRQILVELDCVAEQAVMIGDSEYDLAMARSGGMTSVGVSFGVHSSERLRQHGPAHIVDSLPELLDLPL